VKRVRPKAMTACVIIAGLTPILWSHGAGADVMKRIATPMVGGVITSTIMELAVYPAIYFLWRSRELAGKPGRSSPPPLLLPAEFLTTTLSRWPFNEN
jgi:Cu(I)/Ag(I) efflux system membrane protein CusA/SilA